MLTVHLVVSIEAISMITFLLTTSDVKTRQVTPASAMLISTKV